MVKYLRSEKGITLIELLGAILIGAIVLGGAMLLLSSFSHLFHANTASYANNTAIKRTMTTLTSQLSDSTEAVFFAGASELRYKAGDGYMAAVFDAPRQRFTMYRFNGDQTDFENSSVYYTNNGELYSEPETLAENVQAIAYYESDGNDGTIDELVPEVPLANGELIDIAITFNIQKVTASGSQTTVQRTEMATVKLLIDSTAK